MAKIYELLGDNPTIPGMGKKGDRVYALCRPDYGLAADDTRITGCAHVSVTFNETGDYPSFTVPAHILREVVSE